MVWSEAVLVTSLTSTGVLILGPFGRDSGTSQGQPLPVLVLEAMLSTEAGCHQC